MSFLSSISEARRVAPALNYALATVGISLAAAIVTLIAGNNRATIVLLGAVLVAMIVLATLSRLATNASAAAQYVGLILIWAITVVFVLALLFTTTVVFFGWPVPWAAFLGAATQSTPTQVDVLGVTKTVLGGLSAVIGFSSFAYIVYTKWISTQGNRLKIMVGGLEIQVDSSNLSSEDAEALLGLLKKKSVNSTDASNTTNPRDAT